MVAGGDLVGGGRQGSALSVGTGSREERWWRIRYCQLASSAAGPCVRPGAFVSARTSRPSKFFSVQLPPSPTSTFLPLDNQHKLPHQTPTTLVVCFSLHFLFEEFSFCFFFSRSHEGFSLEACNNLKTPRVANSQLTRRRTRPSLPRNPRFCRSCFCVAHRALPQIDCASTKSSIPLHRLLVDSRTPPTLTARKLNEYLRHHRHSIVNKSNIHLQHQRPQLQPQSWLIS